MIAASASSSRRVLLVDDDEDEYVIVGDLLRSIQSSTFDLTWVSSYEEGLAGVLSTEYDVCLVDYRLGERTGLEFLAAAAARSCSTQIVLLTGVGDRNVDLKATAQGAADYLIKGQMTAELLERSIRYAIGRGNVLRSLKASEEVIDRAGRIAGVGAWSYDLRSLAIYWSTETYRIHERKPGYVPTLEDVMNHYAMASRSSLERAVDECIRTGTAYDLELAFVGAQGTHRWVRAVGEAQFEHGVAVRLVGAVQDITSRRTADDALRTSNERLLMASQAAAVGIWEFDIPGNRVRWDAEVYRIFGRLPHGEVEPYTIWADNLHPDDRARAEGEVVRAISGEADFDTEFRILRPGGEVRHLKAAARIQRSPAGEPLLMVGVYYDITERKRAEIELTQTSAMLGTVLASATDVSIIATDAELTIKVFNKGAEQLLGYSSEEVVGVATPLLVHDSVEIEARSQELSTQLGYAVEGNGVLTDPATMHRAREWTYIRKDRRRVPVSLVCSPMLGENGELAGYLSLARDITKAQEQERSLQKAIVRAEEANAAKSQFLANMSHEIRTPLNAVIGLGYLLEQTSLTEEQRSFLTKVQFAGRSLLSVVNNVLDLSKIEAGEMILEEESFDLVDLAQQVGQMLTAQAQSKGIDLVVRPAPGLPKMVTGDGTRLRQILTNLLNNAIKFTERGGVTLTLTQVDQNASSARIRCSVVDTGIGITPEGLARLFAPFAQADASTTRRFGGTGLGLSIARRFAELMGGEVGVRSELGVGSEFWLEVPLGCAQDSGAAATVAPLQVLIIESPNAEPSLRSLVRPLGWISHSVAVADDAVRRLSEPGSGPWPDAILIDGAPRTVSPTTFVARLQSDFPKAELPPIIIVDDESNRHRAEKLLQPVAHVILARPISSSSVFNAVTSVAATRQAVRPAVSRRSDVVSIPARALSFASVLVVDDSDVNRIVAKHILKKQGATVTLCCDGAEAVDLLRATPDAFDVVLMDVQMPILDGNEATRRIRNELQLRSLPIVALTAGALVSERQRALESGMNHFLSKPLDPAELIRVVGRFVEQKRSAARLAATADGGASESRVGDISTAIDLEAVRRVLGSDDALLESLVTRVLEEFAEFALPVEADLADTGTREELTLKMHKLKGSACAIGAKAVQRTAAAAERALMDGRRPDAIAPLMRELAVALVTLSEASIPLRRMTAQRVLRSTEPVGCSLRAAAPAEDRSVDATVSRTQDRGQLRAEQVRAQSPGGQLKKRSP